MDGCAAGVGRGAPRESCTMSDGTVRPTRRRPISIKGDVTLKLYPSAVRQPSPRFLMAIAIWAVAMLVACGGNENSNSGNPSAATVAAAVGADGLPGTAFPTNGNDHVTPGQSHGTYYSNPPTSGWHVTDLPMPGISTTALTAEEIPHFLEHGGVWVLYNCPGGCDDLVAQLTPVVNRAIEAKRPVALAPYQLMSKRIALVAWQRLLTLDSFDESRVQAFIDAWSCKYNPEGPGYCPNTTGTVAPAKDAGSTGFTGRPAASPTPAASTKKTYPSAPALQIDASKTYIATITLAKGGEIKAQLDPRAAPQTVNSFVFLARDGFYDGLTFHRVEPGFVIQGGDPIGNGSGGPGYTIPDEKNDLKHEEGALAMAKSSAPNSAGSQFYITLAPQPALDATYTVFGKVTSGGDLVKQVAKGDRISTITIEER